MATGPYPRYTITELEQIATRLLREHFGDDVPIPVDIDYVVESQPGVSLDFVPQLRDVFGVAGAVLTHPGESRFTIVVDEAVADGLPAFYRFTLAEELAHLVLHRRVLEQIESLDDVAALHASPDYYSHLDRNAKWLASALLMPEQAVRRDAKELFPSLCVTGTTEGIVAHRLTVRLAQRYNVSQRAMTYRLDKSPLAIYQAIRQAFKAGLSELA